MIWLTQKSSNSYLEIVFLIYPIKNSFYLKKIISSSSVLSILDKPFIQTQVQQLNASNVIQNEEKAINLHLIQYLILGKDYLSSNVLANIFVIANQCIHQNSYSVSFARMLYLRAVDYDFNDDNLCPPSQPLVTSSKINEIEDGIMVYPNPTKSWVIIESLNKDVTILKIEVLDIHGRLLQYESNGKSLSKINLSTTNLKSGIYFLKIECLNDEVILKKLLIE